MLIAAAQAGVAHPTEETLRGARAERAACEVDVPAAERVDPARLGMSLAQLREAVGPLQQDPEPAAGAETNDAPTRWLRDAGGDLARVEYELFRDSVYRIRWQLSPEYERPALDGLSRRAQRCFGAPRFDQKFEAEPGSPAATLRRIGWTHGERRIELRQLHPLRGGPVFLSISSNTALRALGKAGHAPFPEPDRSEPWWQRETSPLEPVTAEEQSALDDRFARLLAQLDH